MARHNQIVAVDDRRLWSANPEIDCPFQAERNELPRVLAYELPAFLPFFVHETKFSQLLESPHRFGIVAGVFVTSPQSGEAVVIGHVHFERKVVADHYQPAENGAVARQPRADDKSCS